MSVTRLKISYRKFRDHGLEKTHKLQAPISDREPKVNIFYCFLLFFSFLRLLIMKGFEKTFQNKK